jgi:hypothetical protein
VLARERNEVVAARDQATVADIVARNGGTALTLKLDVAERLVSDGAPHVALLTKEPQITWL